MALPRFYFIPNDDLLEILGTSDPQADFDIPIKPENNIEEWMFKVE